MAETKTEEKKAPFQIQGQPPIYEKDIADFLETILKKQPLSGDESNPLCGEFAVEGVTVKVEGEILDNIGESGEITVAFVKDEKVIGRINLAELVIFAIVNDES